MKLQLLAAGAVSALILAVAPAMATSVFPGDGDPFILNFDENGNASVSDNGAPFVPVIGTAIAGGGVEYLLPEPVGLGAAGVGDSGGSLSDILNFVQTGANYFLDYYSLDCLGAMADTCGINPLGFAVSILVTEAADGSFTYLPGGNVYNGLSDVAAVPEPAGLAILSSALLGFGVLRRRRRV